jgi:hypothetical protein
VCAWLSSQLSVLTAAPLSLLLHAPQAADAIACTCAHTGHDECPMHHPKSKKSGCECRSTTDPDAASILSLLGPIAVLSDAPARNAPPSITQLPDSPITRFTSLVESPDGPPPRA